MDGSYPGKLRVWEAWTFTDSPIRPFVSPNGHSGGASASHESAARWFEQECLSSAPPAGRPTSQAEPYSLQWFLQIEGRRHQRYARWLPRLFEFTKHAGETLLGIGGGLGTDWAQYALHGASVLVCNESAEELDLARRNFEVRGLNGRFLHAGPTSLPLENASLDVVCVNTFLPESQVVSLAEEIHRVLKPGGKVLVLVPARLDIDWWSDALFPWYRWVGGSNRPACLAEGRWTARPLRRLFGRFIEPRVHKRHLRRSDVPHLWRWLPLPLLERWFGHFLLLKAFKPLSTALPAAAAA